MYLKTVIILWNFEFKCSLLFKILTFLLPTQIVFIKRLFLFWVIFGTLTKKENSFNWIHRNNFKFFISEFCQLFDEWTDKAIEVIIFPKILKSINSPGQKIKFAVENTVSIRSICSGTLIPFDRYDRYTIYILMI